MKQKQSLALTRHAYSATEIVAHLARLDGWTLHGEGATLAIEKTCAFGNYYETMAFVNAVAFIAHAKNHHPDLLVQYQRCVVRFNTHDVKGLSASDFECAALVDALLA